MEKTEKRRHISFNPRTFPDECSSPKARTEPARRLWTYTLATTTIVCCSLCHDTNVQALSGTRSNTVMLHADRISAHAGWRAGGVRAPHIHPGQRTDPSRLRLSRRAPAPAAWHVVYCRFIYRAI